MNRYLDWVSDEMKTHYAITLNIVHLADAADAVKRIQTESRAGRTTQGSVDLLWVNGENFRTLNVGDFMGKKRKVYGEKLQEYLDDPSKVIPGGESVDSFIKRSAGAFDKVRADSQRTLVVTSRSNIFGLIGKSTDAEVKIANPGGVYTLNNGNKLTQVLGGDTTDTLAGS